jgi:small subunit ribosomal protein S18
LTCPDGDLHGPWGERRGRPPIAKSRSGPRRSKKKRPFDSGRRRSCNFCKDKIEDVDYKDVATLRRYVSDRGKIKSRRTTGACRRHQRQVAEAVKRAREMALLPYVVALTGDEKRGRRRRRRD